MNNAQKLRKLYKKTQNDIADIIKYPKPLYAAFELNKMSLPENKLIMLSRYYNVTVDYLLSDSGKEK